MNCIVVDASVSLSWCFPDEQTPSSMGVLDRLQSGEKALVPVFWAVEVLNTLLVGQRRGRITAEPTATFLDTLKILKPALDHGTFGAGRRASPDHLSGRSRVLKVETFFDGFEAE